MNLTLTSSKFTDHHDVNTFSNFALKCGGLHQLFVINVNGLAPDRNMNILIISSYVPCPLVSMSEKDLQIDSMAIVLSV